MNLSKEQKDNIENFNTIFVCNESGHDFSPALKYGKIKFVTRGLLNRYAVGEMARYWMLSLKDSKKEDLILVTSLTNLVCVGCAIFGWLHGRINVLLFRNDKYIRRTVVFDQLLKATEGREVDKENSCG